MTVTAKQLEKIHFVLMQLSVPAMQKHEDYSISFTKAASIVISIKIWRTLVDASFLLAATAPWFSPRSSNWEDGYQSLVRVHAMCTLV